MLMCIMTSSLRSHFCSIVFMNGLGGLFIVNVIFSLIQKCFPWSNVNIFTEATVWWWIPGMMISGKPILRATAVERSTRWGKSLRIWWISPGSNFSVTHKPGDQRKRVELNANTHTHCLQDWHTQKHFLSVLNSSQELNSF